MSFKNLSKLRFAMALLLSAALLGCGGGGGGDDDGATTNPGAEVLPADFDFGTVTMGNEPDPLEVKINSTGTANLVVSNIVLGGSNAGDFSIDVTGGSDPCGSTSPTIAPGEFCTFEVAFNAQSAGAKSATVQITTNAQDPTVTIQGTFVAVTSLIVNINQVAKVCPANDWKAYVSVTDQAGYAYTGLVVGDFSLALDPGGVIPIDNLIGPPTAPSAISVVAVMDYSTSITDYPEIVSDMEEGLVDFINQMRATDRAAIIKFNSNFSDPVFSSDKAVLAAAIRADFPDGNTTRLYDAVFQAIDALQGETTPRKAIIVITDGRDGYTDPADPHDLASVIADAQASEEGGGIPVFPIALGDQIALADLQQLADDTGGQLYEAMTSDNIRNSYLQLASVLYQNQYVLEFNDLAFGGTSANMTVTVTAAPLAASTSNPKAITLCP